MEERGLELTPEARRARGCSGLTSRLILAYVERAGGRAAVERLLALTGLEGREDELRDEQSWWHFDTKIALWEGAAEVLDDPQVARHAAAAVFDLNVAGPLKAALRALGTPELVYRNIVRANAKFNWAHRLDLVELHDERARLRQVDVSDAGYHRADCAYTEAMLCVVPVLFGLPAARIHHVECGALGAEACEWEVAWSGGLQTLRRNAILTGVGALASAGAAAVALPEAVPFIGAGGALSAAVLGFQAVRTMRARLGILESRVVEQELEARRIFSSLGDLSSDLRLGDVLDKVAGRASDALGGKEFALLLAQGEGMRADRHSGIPEASLRALEDWAESHAAVLRERALQVDDVRAIPALAELPGDPDVPLGSLCAAGMRFRDEMLGVLITLAPGDTVFLPHDADALGAYAAQAAIAISNARLVERLERQAAEDPLTGVANQRAFNSACSAEFARSERDGHTVAVVAIDLDHFKSINDTHGHPFGDDVLRGVATALRSVVRPHDTVARLGGEEFALLLPEVDAAGAREVAERAREAIAGIAIPDRTLSSSAGVAAYPECRSPRGRLLQLADRALYEAKARGRSRTVVYEPAKRGAKPDAVSVVASLLEPGAITSVYQPIVELSTGRVAGYEALARFPGLQGADIGQVFEEAHRAGLGSRLEAAALRSALDAGLPPNAVLTVNLSLSALASSEIWAVLPDDLTGITIEITEHDLFGSDRELERMLARLREAGAAIALDDAGAGYAGLSQLMRVRPDVVKLDRSLVAGLSEDGARAALVASFARFAEQTGLAVCAEGVELVEDLETLAELDVSYAQGWLLGRPAEPWATVDQDAVAAVAAPVRGGTRLVNGHVSDPRIERADSVERLRAVLAANTGAREVIIWRYEPALEALVAVTEDGLAEPERLPLHAALARTHVLASGQPGQIVTGDPGADPLEIARLAAEGAGRMLLVPIMAGGRAVGLVECRDTATRGWSRDAVARVQSVTERLGALLTAPAPHVVARAA